MARVQGMVALNSGFKSFSIYEPRDLSLDFKIRNAETLTYSRGAGFWIWKPRIILDHLKKIAPDEIVLYLFNDSSERIPTKQAVNLPCEYHSPNSGTNSSNSIPSLKKSK